MKTSEAIDIIQEAITKVGGGEIHSNLMKMLDALETQQEFETADENTRRLLSQTISVCEAAFILMSVSEISKSTIESVIADARVLIKKMRECGLIV